MAVIGDLEDLGVDRRMLEWILERWRWEACVRFTWLCIGTSGGLLWTFGYHKIGCLWLVGFQSVWLVCLLL